MSFSSYRSKPTVYDPSSKNPFRVSRSKIDLFVECPLCFYLDTRLGVKRPDTYPLTLNLAVDALLKKEFDIHRAKGNPHPMMKVYKIDAVPLKHKDMNTWRELNFGRGGIHHTHAETNLDVYGVVDDIWVSPRGEFFVVDYKATSKRDTPTLDGDLGAQYKRQMEVYQWLLRQNGFTVSETGYFLYVNGKKDAEAFDGKLEFDITILPCVGDTRWIDDILPDIKKTLENDMFPKTGTGCKYCPYRESAGKILQKKMKTQKEIKKPHKPEQNTGSLF